MTKVKKQRRKKVYNYNVNRKRLRNKITSQGNVNCKEIKKAWDERKSLQTNLTDMGLCYNPNKTIKIGGTKKEKVAKVKQLMKDSEDQEWEVEDMSTFSKVTTTQSKKHVLDALIEDAAAPRARRVRFPKGPLAYVTHMLTEHGLDYKAMAKDKKNYNQETWKQLRSKIKRFQSIPEQYNVFLQNASKNVLEKLECEVQIEEDD